MTSPLKNKTGLKSQIIFSLILASVFYTVHLTGGWVALGAHPWWSGTVTYIAVPSAFLVSLLCNFAFTKSAKSLYIQLAVFLIITALMFALTTLGKREFVGSYAENAIAGKYWYFGFMGFVFSLFNTLVALFRIAYLSPNTDTE